MQERSMSVTVHFS